MKNVRIHSFTGPYFLVFGLNKEIYIVNICIQSEYGKCGSEKTLNLDLFQAVIIHLFLVGYCKRMGAKSL